MKAESVRVLVFHSWSVWWEINFVWDTDLEIDDKIDGNTWRKLNLDEKRNIWYLDGAGKCESKKEFECCRYRPAGGSTYNQLIEFAYENLELELGSNIKTYRPAYSYLGK